MKKTSLIVGILSIIETICYFTPFCLTKEYWKYENAFVYHGRSTLTASDSINIFGVSTSLGNALAILLLCITLAVAVVYLIKAAGAEFVVCDKSWLFATAYTAVLVVFLIYVCNIAEVDEVTYRWEYSLGWMSFILIAVNNISTALALLEKFRKIKTLSITPKDHLASKNVHSLDELSIYKELLDAGALTQEEFDEKKKQILGL